VPDAVGIAIERWMQEKQGIQQELLPPAGRGGPQVDAQGAGGELAPVVAQTALPLGSGGEQMVLGGMQQTLSGACPDCGSQLEFAEGCMKCHVCGFSECG
jgi:ribonucleoside-diphosphate reductase alpha chain